ncbi:MAG: hypothetical protein HYZ46_02445 [Nitrosomonadales bacterium]|nr:hypothetical protein [Nitrosomonadales bacterium]
MMTLILIVSGILIALVGLLRYDIHKHKYRAPANPGDAQEPDEHNDKA